MTTLHRQAGFTNWAFGGPLHSWCTWTNKAILNQVVCALTALVWTAELKQWVDAGGRIGDGDGASFEDAVEAAEAEFSAEQGGGNYWQVPLAAHYADTYVYYDEYEECTVTVSYARCWRESSKYSMPKATNSSVVVDCYFTVGMPHYPNPPDPDCYFDENGDGVTYSPICQALQHSFTVDADVPGITNSVGRTNDPPVRPESEGRNIRGYWVDSKPLLVLRWAIDRTLPENFYESSAYNPEAAWVEDSDRDDLVDVGVEIDRLGPDTGTIEWVAGERSPVVIMPLSSGDEWRLTGVPVHDYMTIVPVLPYQVQKGYVLDSDGPCTAISRNTRIVEWAEITNETDLAAMGADHPVKQVSIQRPRGQLVVFDFAWQTNGGESGFSRMGYPVGIHSNRSYVLCYGGRDEYYSEEMYALRFESGVTHHFGGNDTCDLRAVSNSLDQAGGSLDLEYAKYSVDCTWSNSRPTLIQYTSTANTSGVISVSVEWDAAGTNVTAIVKSGPPGVGAYSAAVSGNAIVYGNGVTKTRQVTATGGGGRREAVSTTGGSASGTLVAATTMNEAGRVVKTELESLGETAVTEYEYLDQPGRFPNGLLKCSRVARIDHSDGRWAAYEYGPGGWVTNYVVPSAWGDVTVAYGYDSNDSQIDPGPNTNNWLAHPRSVVQTVAGNVVGRELRAFSLLQDEWSVTAVVEETRGCLSPSAVWTTEGNLRRTRKLGSEACWIEWQTPSATNHLSFDSSVGDWTFTAPGAVEWWGSSPFSSVENGELTDFWGHRDGELVEVWTSTDLNPFGVPLDIVYQDGSTYTVDQWNMRGPTAVHERDGSPATMAYDEMGRLTNRIYQGRTLTLGYDTLGHVVLRKNAVGGEEVEESWAWDVWGRMVGHEDALGSTSVAHSLENGVLVSVQTTPDGASITTKRHVDGTVLEVSGSGCASPVARVPGFDEGLPCITEYVGDASSSRWIRHTYDLAGRLLRVRRSGAAQPSTVTYDQQGRPFKLTDEEGVTRLLEYSAAGEIAKMGLNLGGAGDVLENDGLDRIQTTARVGRSASIGAFPTKGSGNEQTLFSATRSADARSVSGTAGGRPFAAARTDFQANGEYSIVVTNTDDSVWTLGYEKWQLASIERRRATSLSSAAITRDELGEIREFKITRAAQPRTWEFERDEARRVNKIKLPGLAGSIDIGYRAGTDWITSWTEPDGTTTAVDYYNSGLPQRRSGGGESVEWAYTAAAEMQKQTTYPAQGQSVETECVRHATTGFPAQKKIGGAVVEEYDVLENGDLEEVTTAFGTMTVNRSQQGEVVGVTVADGMTPIRGLEFDRLGRVIGDGYANGFSNHYCYALDGRLTTNTVLGGGAISNHEWRLTYEASHGELETATLARNGSTRSIMFGFDDEPKVVAVTDAGTVAAVYGWQEAVPGVSAAAVVVSGVTNPVRLSKQWNIQRGVVTAVTYQAGAEVLASFGYSYPTNAARISRMTLNDGTFWEYGYDGMRRLTNAVRKTSAGEPIPGFSFRYAFDGVGNSLAGGGATTDGSLWRFEALPSQFHVRRVWSNLVEIVGEAATDAVVSVRTDAGIVRAERTGARFMARVPVSNQNNAVFCPITVAAVRNDGTNDLIQETVGRLHIPKLDEAVTNGIAGVILNDSRWTYTWDMHRQLRSIESSGRDPDLKLQFTYDPDGRRIRKQVSEWSGSSWVSVRSHHFTYLGWRPVEEVIVTATNEVVRQYVWGLDLSGTPEGAGGIGGLAAIRENGVVYVPLCDAMGNVRHLVDSQGVIIATYDFDPFGRLIAKSGPAADRCPFLYSTKYLDPETGFYYYGYRYYDPCSLKWLSRDPLGEAAGPNLTAFCRNDPVNNFDPLGLVTEADAPEILWRLSFPPGARGDVGTFLSYPKTKDEIYGRLSEMGYTVYADDFSRIIKSPGTIVRRKQAFMLIGYDSDDPGLFRRLSTGDVRHLLGLGYDVSVLRVSPNDYGAAGRECLLSRLVSALRLIKPISALSIYAHGRDDLNLTDVCEISPAQHAKLFGAGSYSDDCRAKYFTCTPGERAQVLANAIRAPVLAPRPSDIIAESAFGGVVSYAKQREVWPSGMSSLEFYASRAARLAWKELSGHWRAKLYTPEPRHRCESGIEAED